MTRCTCSPAVRTPLVRPPRPRRLAAEPPRSPPPWRPYAPGNAAWTRPSRASSTTQPSPTSSSTALRRGSTEEAASSADARRAAIRLASASGVRLDDACPIADGTLPGGVRLHAVLAPVSGSGTLISLRVLGTRRLGISDLAACGTLPGAVGTLLRALVASRANVLVSGATGSGKTTLLSAALALVPAGERIVCIEEVTEIAPAHPHCVHLIERAPNVEGRGAVTLADLVRAAMRMRPDRLVLGECRGPEVRDVLTALNTGHDGGWATIHANGAHDVPARLAALGALAGMSEHAVAAQAASAIDAVLHLRRAPSGHRWVSEVGVLTRARGSLECALALSATADGCVTTHEVWASLARRVGL